MTKEEERYLRICEWSALLGWVLFIGLLTHVIKVVV